VRAGWREDRKEKEERERRDRVCRMQGRVDCARGEEEKERRRRRRRREEEKKGNGEVGVLCGEEKGEKRGRKGKESEREREIERERDVWLRGEKIRLSSPTQSQSDTWQ
jgi:hypothetical protein